MKIIHHILKRMYEDKGLLFGPVPMQEIQRASIELVKSGQTKIPNDYVAFLMDVNGLYWNGLTLFSLNEKKRVNEQGEEQVFNHPGILNTYERYMKNPLIKNQLIIGTGLEEVIAYSASQKEYRILSRYDYRVMVKFPRFIDVLYYYANRLYDDIEVKD